MKTVVEYGVHGLPRKVEVVLINGKRSKSVEMLQNCSEKPNGFISCFPPLAVIVLLYNGNPFLTRIV